MNFLVIPDIIFLKIKEQANKCLFLIRKTHIQNISLKDIFTSADRFVSPAAAAQHFRARKGPLFFLPETNLTGIVNEKGIKEEAEHVLNHRFYLLGQDISYNDSIKWHTDFKTGYSWAPQKYYKDIEIPYGQGDIKLPWELSRFQHLSVLGQAYTLTHDERYTDEFIKQIEDWIAQNPNGEGVNWRCAMDVAIRACNWALGFYFFKSSARLTDEFIAKFIKSLSYHGRHIYSNLERYGSLTSNHYLADIAGLIYLGILFPELKEAGEWKSFGLKELTAEMQNQIYPDGTDFEASTCYHRLVLELFFFPTLLAVLNDPGFDGKNHAAVCEKIFGKEYTSRLHKMFEAVLYLLKPNGEMPQIGDNDNGRLHILAQGVVLDMRYLLCFGAIFFNDPQFRVKEFGFCPEVLWIFGVTGKKVWDNLTENTLARLKSKSFPDSGWYVMRDNRNYLIISCGPNGQNGNGGHSHNDKLSFELFAGEETILIDPGTYVYTPQPEWRNKFRSTSFHNTVVIDDKEQNPIPGTPRQLFRLNSEIKCIPVRWESNAECSIFSGKYALTRRKGQLVHERELRLYANAKRLELIDRFEGKGEHSVTWNFTKHHHSRKRLSIHSKEIHFQENESYYSPEYGKMEKTVKLTGSTKAQLPSEHKFILTWD